MVQAELVYLLQLLELESFVQVVAALENISPIMEHQQPQVVVAAAVTVVIKTEQVVAPVL
jgi:hypothetical protein